MAGDGRSVTHFSPRRRTAVILSGEGTAAAYFAGVVKALDAAGVRIDLVLGRGVGALVTVFSAFHAEEKISGSGGILHALSAERPFRLDPFRRFAASCLALAFAVFAAPALLGPVALVAFPVQAVLRELLPDSAAAAPGLLSLVVSTLAPYYLPAVALPVIVLFTVLVVRWLSSVGSSRARRRSLVAELAKPPVDFTPLARIIESRLWQTVRGAAAGDKPKDARVLGEAYVQLLGSGLGQHGFREIVFYALDTDTGEEVPFVLVKDRFVKHVLRRRGAGRGEGIDLTGEGSAILFDALRAALSPPGIVEEVPIRLPRGSRFGGEVHRFSSSLVTGGGAVDDAIACGAEQILYVTSAHGEGRRRGSLWERLAARAVEVALENDLERAAGEGVPVFVVRPDLERIAPFEVAGRAQIGGERLSPSALVDQGARDAERLFVQPVLGEDIPYAPPEATVPFERDWKAGPREL